MKRLSSLKTDEQGSVIIVALVILVLLTIIGLSASSTTSIETQIAGNEKFQKAAFNNADSGVPVTAKLVTAMLTTNSEPAIANVTYLMPGITPGTVVTDTSNKVIDQLSAGAPSSTVAYDNRSDIQLSFSGNNTASIDIQRTGQSPVAGSEIGGASGYESIGGGSAGGGTEIYYNLNSTGQGPSNSQSVITANYRKVVGIDAGGL
jgi:Tfp pilus assembly protein PilX